MMKLKSTISALFFLCFISLITFNLELKAQEQLSEQEREKAMLEHQEYLDKHPFSNRPRLSPEEWKKVDKRDRPDLAWEQDFLRTMDPVTRKPERERLFNYMQQRSLASAPGIAPGASGNNWVERGPNNIGGRTRAMAWDPNTANKVWAGGVTGGLWFNNNIHNVNSGWLKVNDFWDNISVTAIAFDPNNGNTMYVGTGEGWGTGSGIGGGIWKSTNGGSSFTLLTSTTSSGTKMSYINDLVVRNEGGSSVVYAAVSRMSYRGIFHGVQGLYRSTNGGTVWTQVLPNVPSTSVAYAPADIEIDAGNRIWIGTRRNSFLAGGGTVLFSDNGTTWTTSTTRTGGRRVELACAPNNQNRVYGMVSGISGSSEAILEIISTSNRGSTWVTRTEPSDADNGIPNTDFSRGQAWYDMILRVDPNNSNTVYAGAINWFRSTNGGFSWTQISKWSNNASMNTLSIPLVHADQHAMEFKPGSSDTVLIGNDGGVFYSTNISTSTTSSLAIPSRNKNYNVTQFYACALHPTAGNNHMLAGSQDNGTIRVNVNGVGAGTEVRGGDGAFCFIDQNQPQFQIASYVYNTYYLSTNGGATTFTTQLIRDLTVGAFINPADYDNNRNALYAARTNTTLTRVRNVTGTFSDDNITVTGMNSRASAIRVSQHTTSSSTVFVGTNNGQVFKVTNADGTPSATRIDKTPMPGGSVSCIEVGGSEDTLLVTYFNYGVNSVWYTTNGGTSWTNKDNTSLPDMPIRWAIINEFNTDEVILATELGVWSCSNINASPTWTGSSNGLANVRVDMLQMRSSDSTVMAATYGRGMFTSKFAVSITTKPNTNFTANDTTICESDTVTFNNSTSGSVTSRLWTFTGGSPATSTAQNPQVSYASSGNYTVRLISTNVVGSDTLTRTNYISVSSNPTVSLGAFANVNVGAAAFALTGGSPVGGTYSGPGVSAGQFNPATAGVGTHTITYSFTNAQGCSDQATSTITVTASVTLTAPGVSCENAGTVSLSGSPAGGSFSGPGVTGITFNPLSVGPGLYTITYTVSGSGSDSKNIRVVRVNATQGTYGAVCSNSNSFTLGNGNPIAPGTGIYKINGTTVTSFDPTLYTPGNVDVNYVYTDLDGCMDSSSVTVRLNAAPVATLTTIPNQCEGNNAFTLTGGGPSIGNFFVNGGVSSSFDPGALGAGNQIVKFDYIDANQCRDSVLQTVVVHPQPTPSFTALSDVCANDASFALTQGSPGGGAYSGPGVAGGFFDPGAVISNNTYTLTYTFTDANSCTDSANQSILVKPIPIIRASNDTAICFGESVQLTAGGGVNYTWTPATGLSASNIANPIATPLINTLYRVTGTTFNSCSNVDSVSIIVNAIPNVNAGQDQTICAGGNFQLNAVGAMTYSWSPSAGLSNANVSNPTGVLSNSQQYVLTGTSMAGCTRQDSLTITVNPNPVVNAGLDTSICEGETYLLGATGATTYLWSPSMGLSSNNIASPTYIVNGTMTYSVIGSNSFGCSDTDAVVITGKQVPVVNMNGLSARCVDEPSFVLNQGSPAGGIYSGPGVIAGVQFRPSAAGIGVHNISYNFVASNGCSNSDVTSIQVNSIPQVSISGLKAVYCENEPNDPLLLSPLGGSLSGPGVIFSSFSPNTAGVGSYSLRYSFTDSNTCSNSVEVPVRVSEVLPVAAVKGFKRVLKNQSYTYSVDPVNGASYVWQITNGTLISQANNVAVVQWGTIKDGRITVRQTSLDGCSDSTVALVSVGTVGEEEFADLNRIKVFPNPAKTKLSISINSEQALNLSIHGIEGKLVHQQRISGKEKLISMDISSWPRGIYLVRLNSEVANKVERLVLD